MRRKKKRICLLIIGVIVMLPAVVFAGNVPFDITSPSDPISIREPKDDAEQEFYVTGHTFSFDDALVCVSYQLNDASIYSYNAIINQREPSSSARYRTYARPGVYYYMHGYSYYTGLRVTGTYCP